MNELQIFENPEFGQIRAVLNENGEPLFVAADVCRALDIANNRDAMGRLDDDEKGVVSTDTPGGVQQMACVTEAGLYSLVLGSRKQEAKRFKRWVTHEVIPSIRKHGAYMTPQTLEQALLSPDFLLQLAQRLKEEQEERLAAERDRDHLAMELTIQQPKVDYFDALVDRNLLLSLRETAKLLKVKEKAFIRWLMDNRYLFRGKTGKLLPYATRPHNDCFEVKEWFDRETGKGGVQTLVTPKGRETFRLLLEGKPESGLWAFPGSPSSLPREMTDDEMKRIEELYLSGNC